ncbi:hypothetical protein PTI98_012994 [Pleurotus ostreatus]|nr:hypothetical protein PTI98_012994 [Pleurotus ostreatus]
MSTDSTPTHKVAIITGAAQGIGRAIALQLAADGLAVMISDIASKLDQLNAVAMEIQSKKGRAQVMLADVSSESDVNNLVAKTKEAFGGLDVMVANAGVAWPNSLLDVTVEEWDRLFSVNVRGVLLCYQAAARLMIEQKRGGRIIGASSIGGKKAGVMIGAYSASKFAVRSLTQTAGTMAPSMMKLSLVHPLTAHPFSTGVGRTWNYSECICPRCNRDGDA